MMYSYSAAMTSVHEGAVFYRRERQTFQSIASGVGEIAVVGVGVLFGWVVGGSGCASLQA